MSFNVGLNFAKTLTKGIRKVANAGLQTNFKANKLITSPIQDEFISSKNWKKLLPTLKEKITPQNLLGSGIEADVYALDDNFVLRCFAGNKNVNGDFYPVKDIFEGRNFGQVVAETKDKISINKRVSGKALYKTNDKETKKFMENLRKYCNLEDETLENFVSDVAFINSKGWRIDQGNPENFLYNEKTKRIGIIDLSEKGTTSLDLYEPYAHDWIMSPLVNGHDIFSVFKQLDTEGKKELLGLINMLEDRILPLCEKYGVPKATWNRTDYRFSNLINMLDLSKETDLTKYESIFEPIIQKRYPELMYLIEK